MPVAGDQPQSPPQSKEPQTLDDAECDPGSQADRGPQPGERRQHEGGAEQATRQTACRPVAAWQSPSAHVVGGAPRAAMKMDSGVDDIFSFVYDDFRLDGYRFHPHISASVAV